MKRNKKLLIFVILLLIFSAKAMTQATTELSRNIPISRVNGKPTDEMFIKSMADFSIEIFKKGIIRNENSLVSPLSIMLALAMTANGADGETLAQMENLLGGGISLTDLNEYLYMYANELPNVNKSKLNIANSIWFREGFEVEQVFLQSNANYFDASIFRAAFDNQTVRDINDWVSQNTDGLIDRIMDNIDEANVMYLINAIVFDGEWLTSYEARNIRKGDFRDINDRIRNVDFLHSDEYIYLENNSAIGFVKPYFDEHYSFMALLPNVGMSMDSFIAGLTGDTFINIIKNSRKTAVRASMPKFKYDFEISLNDALKSLGMPLAFNDTMADFSRIGAPNIRENIYISEVRHKTFIEVDERGTRAAAVTSVEATVTRAPPPPRIVHLDRPFVFAIIDNKTNLPIFLGTMMKL